MLYKNNPIKSDLWSIYPDLMFVLLPSGDILDSHIRCRNCLWLRSGSELSIHPQCSGFQGNERWTQRLTLCIYEDIQSKIKLETAIVNHCRTIHHDFWLFPFPLDMVYIYIKLIQNGSISMDKCKYFLKIKKPESSRLYFLIASI